MFHYHRLVHDDGSFFGSLALIVSLEVSNMLPADGHLCIDNDVVTYIIHEPIIEIEAHVPEDNVVFEDNDVSDNILDVVVSESISQV
ncbi:hypothetical protein V6N12_066800 [Hibiscus sabdariffa]|uniref:Plastocyanin-like domain-containing protein n=1 Tax=Hibiscus sabdariffa TaxID=183260 RepID=A0ABR2C964_9ROSI